MDVAKTDSPVQQALECIDVVMCILSMVGMLAICRMYFACANWRHEVYIRHGLEGYRHYVPLMPASQYPPASACEDLSSMIFFEASGAEFIPSGDSAPRSHDFYAVEMDSFPFASARFDEQQYGHCANQSQVRVGTMKRVDFGG